MLALLYTCGIAEKRRLEISRVCASADNSLYLKKTSKNQNDYMENAQRYFTPAALLGREDWKFHARAPVQTTLCT